MGNPPFQGGKKITGTLGTDYRDFLIVSIANSIKGNADLCVYFFLRASNLLKSKGSFGLVATNTISQGDTCEVGLDQIAASGGAFYRAIPTRKWFGAANAEVACIWSYFGDWLGEYFLNENSVSGITSLLTLQSKASGNPYSLVANQGRSFVGSYVLGMGFILTSEEAK